jgi:hypothetical protein
VHDPGYTYFKSFLMRGEADSLYRACRGLEYHRRVNPKNPDTFIRHQAIVFSQNPAKRAMRIGLPTFSLAQAPKEILDLAAKLSKYLGNGRDVNYLAPVLYEDGEDFIDWHQHGEDKGHDTPVLILSTGAARNFSIREAGRPKTTQHITVRPGDLIVLPSEANDTHEHAVLKAPGVTSARTGVNCKCVDSKYFEPWR